MGAWFQIIGSIETEIDPYLVHSHTLLNFHLTLISHISTNFPIASHSSNFPLVIPLESARVNPMFSHLFITHYFHLFHYFIQYHSIFTLSALCFPISIRVPSLYPSRIICITHSFLAQTSLFSYLNHPFQHHHLASHSQLIFTSIGHHFTFESVTYCCSNCHPNHS